MQGRAKVGTLGYAGNKKHLETHVVDRLLSIFSIQVAFILDVTAGDAFEPLLLQVRRRIDDLAFVLICYC